jgi:hypothetical protein
MNRFNFRLDEIRWSVHICLVSIQDLIVHKACIDSNKRSRRISQAAPGDSKMEAMILASYVLKSNQQPERSHPALDETAHQSARSALSSIAATMAGIAAFAVVLTLFR